MAHPHPQFSFQTYQCSTSVDLKQRNVVASSSYRQVNRNDVSMKEKSGRFLLSSLKGKLWSSFSEVVGCESSK